MRYLVKIAFVGSEFNGFQVQPGKRTVQGALCEAAQALFGVPCAVTGCSRTDSGVHAREFFATVEPCGESRCVLPPDRLPQALRPFLSPDLSICSSREAPAGFHVRHDVRRKEYRYFIRLSETPDPFLTGRVWFYPAGLPDGALPLMRDAARALLGEHDFASFMASGSKITDTRRTLFAVDVTREDELLTVSVTGDGFLYNMVRIIVGTLLDIGEGKRSPADLPAILEAHDRRRAGRTAPPQGLFLWRVEY